MLNTHHSQLRLSKFVSLYRSGRLNLEPAFQRRSVWTQTDRRKLLKSVFDGIPLPSIYLYERPGVNGAVEYDVIDGKQRLEALMLFMSEGPLFGLEPELRFKSDLDGEYVEAHWWAWSELPTVFKKLLRAAKLPVITVTGEFSEIAELFVSINSTGKKLTGQEKRHAFHEKSNALKAATTLAESLRPEFRRLGVFSEGQMTRMVHIEFVLELMLYAASGVHPNKKSKLDEIVQGDHWEVATCRKATSAVRQAINTAVVILPNLKSTRFKQRADFYTLVCVLIHLKDQGYVMNAHDSHRNRLAGGLLTGFALGVEEVGHLSGKAQNVPTGFAEHTNYLMTVKEGTDSASNRKKRASILIDKVLAGIFDEQDVNRLFNTQQRRILWNRSIDKVCGECGLMIERWEDMNADHVLAFVNGGKTTLANGAITHKWCNQSKGAKPGEH